MSPAPEALPQVPLLCFPQALALSKAPSQQELRQTAAQPVSWISTRQCAPIPRESLHTISPQQRLPYWTAAFSRYEEKADLV